MVLDWMEIIDGDGVITEWMIGFKLFNLEKGLNDTDENEEDIIDIGL
jgi:hypothetical protein